MRFLLDTHLLLWTSFEPERLTLPAAELISNDDHELVFSEVSIWEVAIKYRKHPRTFSADPALLPRSLLDRNFVELSLNGQHALAIASLPLIHRDPSDRIILAQALVENLALATVDEVLLGYDVPTRYVG